MSAEDKVRAVLEGAIKAEFCPSFPSVPIEWENLAFKPPERAVWFKVNIIENDVHRANIGNVQEFKAQGVMNIQIQAPEKTGVKEAKAIRQALFDVLADKQRPFDGGSVTTYACEKRTRGVINGWYALALVVPYRYFFRRGA